MSTLNSSQLHVKRSSTRLHAPPGGASSLSFGPGGFGTVDVAPSTPHEKDIQPHQDYMQCKTTPIGENRNNPTNQAPEYGGGAAYRSYNQPPPSTAMSGYAGIPPSSASGFPMSSGAPPSSAAGFPMSGGFSGGYPPSSGAQNATPNFGWGERGSQPPLTSSKRDQNWEKKRRLWLARKNGMGGCGTPGASSSRGNLSTPLSPGTGQYGGGYAPPAHGMNNMPPAVPNPWSDQSAMYNPPSPLTKFVQQQSQKQQFGQYAEESMMPQTPGGAAPGPVEYGYGGVPPRTATTSTQQQPPPTSYGYGSGAYTAAGSYGHVVVAPPPSAGSGRPSSRGVTTASSSSAPSSRSSSRQPPGGHSNWSPFSGY